MRRKEGQGNSESVLETPGLPYEPLEIIFPNIEI